MYLQVPVLAYTLRFVDISTSKLLGSVKYNSFTMSIIIFTMKSLNRNYPFLVENDISNSKLSATSKVGFISNGRRPPTF